MQKLIDRLKAMQGQIELADELVQIAVQEELSAIIEQLKVLDAEHTRQTDELTTLRESYGTIKHTVNATRRKLNINQEGEVSNLEEDVADLLNGLTQWWSSIKDDAAAMRGALEIIRDAARKVERDDVDPVYIQDLLARVAHQAADTLKVNNAGTALRKDWRQLEAMVEAYELQMRATGGWTFTRDLMLAERVQRCMDHYTRMAAQAVGDAHGFKDGVVSWLRGIAINAQAVSWGSTHHEKDARLRGLIEVIETAIEKINTLRLNDRLSEWNGVVDSWMKSDFPTREMRRRILDQDEEIKRLRQKAGEPVPEPSDPRPIF